jgi:hypothetical protein
MEGQQQNVDFAPRDLWKKTTDEGTVHEPFTDITPQALN